MTQPIQGCERVRDVTQGSDARLVRAGLASVATLGWYEATPLGLRNVVELNCYG